MVIFTEKEIDVTREQNLAKLSRAHMFIVIDGKANANNVNGPVIFTFLIVVIEN